MGGRLASKTALANRPIQFSALVADRAERRLARGPGCLAQSIDQRLDRARSCVARDVQLAELFAARLLCGIGRGPGTVGEPAADLAQQLVFGPRSGEQCRKDRTQDDTA